MAVFSKIKTLLFSLRIKLHALYLLQHMSTCSWSVYAATNQISATRWKRNETGDAQAAAANLHFNFKTSPFKFLGMYLWHKQCILSSFYTKSLLFS
jgi:hypothetical protein